MNDICLNSNTIVHGVRMQGRTKYATFKTPKRFRLIDGNLKPPFRYSLSDQLALQKPPHEKKRNERKKASARRKNMMYTYALRNRPIHKDVFVFFGKSLLETRAANSCNITVRAILLYTGNNIVCTHKKKSQNAHIHPGAI